MSKRIAHKLKANKKTYLPKKFIFFDTETYPIKINKDLEIHKLKLGWVCLWQRSMSNRPEMIKWFYFDTVDQFWDFINSNLYAKERIVLIAHNFVYDFTMVKGWTEAIKHKYKLSRLYEKNHVFISRYKKSDRSILCLDNMNFFICSLEQLGKEIGIHKLKIDFDNCTNEQLSIYCKQDVNILLQSWKKYIKWFTDNDLGNFGVTISAQSFNSFRHKFMKHDIYIHNRKYVSTLERQSYYGGRTECFKIGHFTNRKFYYLDINSMYPAVMASNFYPIRYFKYSLKMSITELKFYLEKYCIVARVKINTKKPLFPYRTKTKIIFPIGQFEAVLSSPELDLAIKENVLKEVISVAMYYKGKIFEDFIDFFYSERLEAKAKDNYAYSLFFKLIMNSLYGKFGQLSGEWQTRGKCDPLEVDYWNETIQGDRHIYKMRKINGLVQRYERKEESFNSFCAISSHVTSYARIKLWNLMNQANMKNVYYCDTDSLFVNEKGYKNLKTQIDNTALGQLKIEAKTNNLKIIGCKHYQFGDKIRHKGRKKDAQMINPNTFKQKQWSSLTRLIHNRDLNNFQVINIVKTFSHLYDKGSVQANGEVKPLIL